LNSFRDLGGRNLPFPILKASGLYNSLYYRTSRDYYALFLLSLLLMMMVFLLTVLMPMRFFISLKCFIKLQAITFNILIFYLF